MNPNKWHGQIQIIYKHSQDGLAYQTWKSMIQSCLTNHIPPYGDDVEWYFDDCVCYVDTTARFIAIRISDSIATFLSLYNVPNTQFTLYLGSCLSCFGVYECVSTVHRVFDSVSDGGKWIKHEFLPRKQLQMSQKMHPRLDGVVMFSHMEV